MLRQLGQGASVLLYISLLVRATWGTPLNRTIDDTDGDEVTGVRPQYLPGGPWEDAGCGGCAIQPDRSKAFHGTWTAATFHPELKNISINFGFRGTAIYVFFIVADIQGPGVTTLTECDFYVDSVYSSNYRHAQETGLGLEYNVLVFYTTNLTNADHRVNIVTANKNYSTFINFDYAIYTIDDEPMISPSQPLISPSQPLISSYLPTDSPTIPIFSPSDSLSISNPSQSLVPLLGNASKEDPSIGVIIGSVIGGITTLGLFAILFCFWYWRSRSDPVRDGPPHTEVWNRAPPFRVGDSSPRSSVLSPRAAVIPFYGSEKAVGLRGFILQKYEEPLPRYLILPPARTISVPHSSALAEYLVETPMPLVQSSRLRYDGHGQSSHFDSFSLAKNEATDKV